MNIDFEIFCEIIMEKVLDDLKGERAPSNAHKIKELKAHINKILPSLWDDLVESVNME